MNRGRKARNPEETRRKILDAARDLVLRQGFTATGIDQICREAGVTKGAFFHHFESKEDLGHAILEDWAAMGMAIYRQVENDPARHPLDPLRRFFDVMESFVREESGAVTCIVGMLAQEVSLSNPALRKSSAGFLREWSDFACHLLDKARESLPVRCSFRSRDVANFLNALWQGSMLVAKACDEPDIIINNLRIARAYVESLFVNDAEAPAVRRRAVSRKERYLNSEKRTHGHV